VPARGEQESWDVVYYRQADGQTPAIDFLDGCPIKRQARFDAVLDDVAAAPPPRYSGGGRWEAMHGDMGGFYEVRLGDPTANNSGCSASSTTGQRSSFAIEA